MLNALLGLLFLVVCAQSLVAAPRNLVVIYTDDHGWPDLGCQGIYDDLKTPHIDALAASGVRATNGYSTAPQCVPSRAGLLSGKFQSRFGVESNGKSLTGFDAEDTIAERLQGAGYRTAQIGKWHLGPTEKITAHGFDHVFYRGGEVWNNVTIEGVDAPPGSKKREGYHVINGGKAARALINRYAKEEAPFFIYFAPRAPHVPLDATKELLARFPGEMPERRRQALAMIAAIDDAVGEIVAGLAETGTTKETMIFFIGDNGAPLKIHKTDAPGGGPGWDGSLNEPMNGEKGMLTEGGIRVPFVVAYPGTIPGDQVYEHPLSSLDVAATALALAGLESDPELDGVNLIPYLDGSNESAPHEFLTWRWLSQSAVREGRWKFLRSGEREYLFDLKTDVGETKNLRTEHPEVFRRLRGRLAEWGRELQPPGLGYGPPSSAANKYFDHYLDGRKAAKPVEPESGFEEWVIRGGSSKVTRSGLQITPLKNSKSAFLAKPRFQLDGPFQVTLEFRAPSGTTAGIAWRGAEEKDFTKANVVKTQFEEAEDWQTVKIDVPAKGRTIHLRVLLPDGAVVLRKMTVGKEEWSVR